MPRAYRPIDLRTPVRWAYPGSDRRKTRSVEIRGRILNLTSGRRPDFRLGRRAGAALLGCYPEQTNVAVARRCERADGEHRQSAPAASRPIPAFLRENGATFAEPKRADSDRMAARQRLERPQHKCPAPASSTTTAAARPGKTARCSSSSSRLTRWPSSSRGSRCDRGAEAPSAR